VRLVGVDLAWSAHRASGVLALNWDGTSARPMAWDALTGVGAVVDFIARTVGGGPALVAVDAPLLVPNETGTRPGDRALSREYRQREAGAYPANRRRLGPDVVGEVLVAKLRDHGFTLSPLVRRRAEVRQVVEVYPHPAQVELFGLPKTLKYKARPGRTPEARWAELRTLRDLLGTLARREPPLRAKGLLEDLDPWGLRGRSLKRVEDLLDALVCAYVALHLWFWGEMGYRAFGDLRTGFILVPTRRQDRGRPAGPG